jgi:hypothetical protein
MIRKLSALSMVLLVSACAAQSKRAAEPSMAPASPSGAEPVSTPSGGAAAPSTAPMPATGATTVEETSPSPENPSAGPPPPTPVPGATQAPTTKAPATAAKPTAPPGTDAGGSGGKKANAIGAAQSSFDDARKTFIAAADCVHMCKALTSMSNATTHLCELTQGGGEQKRCTDAKAKLAAADAKVKSTCGGCTP